ncbi:glycosyltransferase [Clostridium gasigenes]|uniref:Glycosyltransferase involved in cell wall bisynthesis n=1 Tax=Clostridium gasigenes TaxID=94869 RepID=A0A1H0TI23_9CLOT|nr:glycosyltransferase [Clostridium gasigenes]SDP53196.1 Glycosyltransferase involved in cell wall bisynthesis [Clostridium gasigenes]
MKVLVLPSWYPDKKTPLNGIFFKEQAEALVKSNVEVIVLSIAVKSFREFDKENRINKLEFSEENKVKVYRYTTYNYFPKLTELYLKYYSIIMKKLIKKVIAKEGNPDLIHIHSALDAGIAFVKAKIDIPYVVTEHSTKYSRGMVGSTEGKYLRKLFQNASRVMVVGNGLKEELSKYISKDKLQIIYNPVVMPNYEIKEDKNKSKFRFFSLGFLAKKKAMDALIEAFNSNKEKIKDVELFIGGDGEEFNNLKKLIDDYELNDKIFLLGSLNREEVAFNMKNCDCFVLPSRFETFGIVYVEAMNYGKPVIATRTGGPDTFVNEKCGVLIDVDNKNQLIDAMELVINNYDKYDSKEIKKYCKENFSEKVIMEELKKIYKEVIGESNVK